MSISSATNRNDYTGNGATSAYSYTFRITDEDHLLVTVKNTSDVESTLTIDTDYTVSGVGSSSGGTVTLVNSSQAWLDGDGDLITNYTITIRRVVPLTQETDIRNQGDFYPEVHEDQFDYQTFIDQQQQDEIDRSVKNPESLPASSFDPTLPTDIDTASVALVTNATGDGFEIGPTTTEISNAQTYATNASTSATLAANYATKIDGAVTGTDYSAKAWSIGGTGVTDTASRGAAKEWAIETASTVDGTDYSSKEYAIGTQIRGAASGGSSKDWATYTSGTADDSEYSAKAYAIGGTGVSDTAGKGAAKEWAIETSGTVDGTDYSAKEYAQGTQTGTGGSAKDWATETASQVDSVDYSAKEYAIGTQTRGAASGGSAKDWAQYTGGTVDDTEYSAKYYAQQASSAVNSAFFRDVVYVTDADSPITIADADNGKLYSIDSSGGTVTINLPTIAGIASLPFNIAFSLGTAGNTVTINRGGTDTIGGTGASSYTLSAAGTGVQMAADTDGTPDNWATLDFGSIADGAVTPAKLASETKALIHQDNIIDNPEGYMFQRTATPGTPVAFNDDTYSVDRWNILCSANDVSVSRDTDAPSNATYAIKLSKTTSAGYFGMCQIKSNDETLALRGETINFTVACKTESSEVASMKLAVLEWTGTADSVTSDVVSSWAASPTWAASFTELVESSSNSLTDSYQDFNVEFTVGASANNLVFVIFTDNSESTSDSIFVSAMRAYITGEQMEYARRSNSEEERRCLRFFWRVYGRHFIWHGGFNTTTEILGSIPFPTKMRTAPTSLGFNATDSIIYDRMSSSAGNSTAVSFGNTEEEGTRATITVASASTIGFPTNFGPDLNDYFEAYAEL